MRRSNPKNETPKCTAIAVPSGAPTWVTAELIEHTVRVWQPYYADPLTPTDALAIIQSVGCLINVFSGEAEP